MEISLRLLQIINNIFETTALEICVERIRKEGSEKNSVSRERFEINLKSRRRIEQKNEVIKKVGHLLVCK